MAYAQVVQTAGQLATKYGPQVAELARKQLAKATGNKATPETLGSYLGNSPQRLKIATEAMALAGVNVNDLIPEDVAGNNRIFAQIRASAINLVGSMQARYDAGSDKTLSSGQDDIAKDELRRERVKAALRVFGSSKAYFLCIPNGGIPVEDFVWYERIIQRN